MNMDFLKIKTNVTKHLNWTVIFILGFGVSQLLDVAPLERRVLLLERALSHIPSNPLFFPMLIHTQEMWTEYLVLLITFSIHLIALIIIVSTIIQLILFKLHLSDYSD